MNRMTKKNEQGGYQPVKQGKILFDCLNKLGELENIEEELGIELVTLFKALKQKIAYCILDNRICPMLVCIEYYKDRGFAISSCGYTYKIKDYGKTWALTIEELEGKYGRTEYST